jgi:hypothetical protein
MTRRCVAFFVGLVRLYRGKIFARRVYKNTNARNVTTMRCHFLRWMRLLLCILVKYLQDGFTNIQTHAMSLCRSHWRCVAFCVGLVRLYLGKIFARWVYKIQTHAMTWRCVAYSDWCVCFFVTYLQDGFTKIQTHALRCFRIGAFV